MIVADTIRNSHIGSVAARLRGLEILSRLIHRPTQFRKSLCPFFAFFPWLGISYPPLRRRFTPNARSQSPKVRRPFWPTLLKDGSFSKLKAVNPTDAVRGLPRVHLSRDLQYVALRRAAAGT